MLEEKATLERDLAILKSDPGGYMPSSGAAAGRRQLAAESPVARQSMSDGDGGETVTRRRQQVAALAGAPATHPRPPRIARPNVPHV